MTIGEVVSRAGELVASIEVVNFLDYYDIKLNPWRPVEMIKALRSIDSRKIVRFEREQDKDALFNADANVIMAAAERMGMLMERTLPTGHWGLGIVCAGARRACSDRLNDLAKAITSGQVIVDNLFLAGTGRILGEAELAYTQTFAPDASTEIELGEAAVEEVGIAYPELGLSKDNCIITARKGTIGVLVEAIENTHSNEDTPDGILVETHQIYREFTLFDAARAASWTFVYEVEVAGCPSDPSVIAARKATTYRYEVARTIVAAIMLLANLDDDQI